MKRILLLFLFCSIAISYSQKAPILHVGKEELALSSLNVKVNIIGNIATTTYDMLFYNPSSRVLEGKLKFPLAENQEVSRLALEMNGKLREAVVVEKELGRIAFEGIVRKGVDPVLLEKGKGNTYNVRVYPIPANGYKRVIIAYEQELFYKEGALYYNLPLNFEDRIDTFNVFIDAINQKQKPILVEGEDVMHFSNWKNSFKTSLEKQNYIPNKSILVKIPIASKEQKLITSEKYFYFYKTLKPQVRKRKKPKKISLYWDVSLSMKDRDIEREVKLLGSYLRDLQNVDVNFVSFSNTIIDKVTYKIRKGNWLLLKEKLERTIYDGGTSYAVIESLKDKSDIVLLYSDGITTLSESSFVKSTPVFIINSKTETAHKNLFSIAEKTKGGYINLNTTTIKEGLSTLNNIFFEYLGYNSYTKNIEVHRAKTSKGLLNFSVAGKNYREDEKIIFYFGYGKDITLEIPVILKSDILEKDSVIKRIWAKNKLGELVQEKRINKKEIIDLATTYGLVTDYTSLIVLEDVQDYVTYNITPPEELLGEYNSIRNKGKIAKRFNNTSNSPVPPPLPEMIQIVEDEKEIMETIIEERETDEFEALEVEEIVENIESEEEIVEDIPFSIVETTPIFPNCTSIINNERKACFNEEIRKFVQNNFNTELGNQLGLSVGRKRIYVVFRINKIGDVENVRVRTPHEKLKREALRVVKLLPRFIPGKKRGIPISVKYALPITFNVNNNGNSGNIVDVDRLITVNRERKSSYTKYRGNLSIADRIPKTAYVNALEFFKDEESTYLFYLKQRESYKNVPHYYIDVSDYFYRKFKSKKYANRILSNVAELDADNYELLRAFAYKLEEHKEHDLALFIYKNILELRPEDAQSYRDLALGYENVGLCQEAFDLFLNILTNKIYEGNEHRRVFQGLHDIAEEEIKLLYRKYKDDLDKEKIPKEFISKATPIDLRVVVDWNHNDTDIDLHIIDPNLEECYYSHPKTKQGGRMSKDMTQGFGPEQFILKNAKKGLYYVKIKYFGDGKQKEETPTFMKVTIFKNQGRKSEEKIVQVLRLTKEDKEEVIAKVEL